MKNYCPICDSQMKEGGRFCWKCKQFVTPKSMNANYYLNTSHTDTKVHHNECDYHTTDTKYDNKPTYTINTNNKQYNSNQSYYNKSTTKASTYTKTSKNAKASGQNVGSKIFIIFLVIFIINFVIGILGVVGASMANKERIDDYKESITVDNTYEAKVHNYVVQNSFSKYYTYDIKYDTFMSMSSVKGRNLSGFEDNPIVYEADYYQASRWYSTTDDISMIVYSDTINDGVLSYVIYSADPNVALSTFVDIFKELKLVEYNGKDYKAIKDSLIKNGEKKYYCSTLGNNFKQICVEYYKNVDGDNTLHCISLNAITK